MTHSISIGMRLRESAYGGGNQFVKALSTELAMNGWEVSYDLKRPSLDIILLIDPRPKSEASAYNHRHILLYLRHNPKTLVVHRVNECDERKGTRGVNAALRGGNHVADYTIFVSEWLRQLHLSQGWPCQETSTILNGSDTRIFNPHGHTPWNGTEPLKLVTHHWGNGWNKGFDVYQRLDAMLAEPAWQNRISFTYIGRLPDGFRFRHATHQPPLSGAVLAAALREHHVYVTGSLNEPGSNHQNEGALCGLPILYLENASMPEYASGYGVGFQSLAELEPALESMISDYVHHYKTVLGYPHTAARASQQYIGVFTDILQNKERFISKRHYPFWWYWSTLGRSLLAFNYKLLLGRKDFKVQS